MNIAGQTPITNEDLYIKQVELLKTFLAHGAITQAQFNKSYGDLTAKMHPDACSGNDTAEHKKS